MRGKVYIIILFPEITGITPAYAGKSGENCRSAVETKDHPRLCGEKFPCKKQLRQYKGSPPPMRGKDSRRKIRTRL